MPAPSRKVTIAFLVTVVTQVAASLARDTSWTGWLPDPLQPFVPVLMAFVSLAASYHIAETRPPLSALRSLGVDPK